MINAIGNIIGGGSARISYAKQLAKAYAARVIADGGVVESLGCFTAFAKALGAFKPTLLLDFYQNAAAAYSLRKLSTTYTGSAIRVRRASDNTEQDIGFVSNELDTSALTTFCSGTNGFVKTWYDQSGNARNATQTTAAKQPQIVSSGSVILENGKPSLQFDGSNDSIGIYSGMPTTIFNTEFTAFTVGLANDNNLEQRLFGISTASNYFFVQRLLTNTDQVITFTFAPSGAETTISYSNWNQNMLYYNKAVINGTMDTAINGSSITSVVTGSSFTFLPSGAGWGFGSNRSGVGNFLNGKIQELIFYSSDQSSSRTGIETNINDFYSIY